MKGEMCYELPRNEKRCSFNPFPNDNFYALPKDYADDNFKCYENIEKFSKRVKMLWKKEKLLITSNFFFFHSVFRRRQEGKTRPYLGKV